MTEAGGQGVVKRYSDNVQIDKARFKKGFPYPLVLMLSKQLKYSVSMFDELMVEEK